MKSNIHNISKDKNNSEISEMCFKNHITVIEKNYIAIHIDIELLSSPSLTISKIN